MEDRDPRPSAFETTSSERDMNYHSITLTASATSRAANRNKVDKENVLQHHQNDNSPKSTPIKSLSSPSPLTLRTPSPGGSPALQQRLSQLSLAIESPARRRFMEHATLRVLTPTRMLDQGPVRILNSISVAEPKPHRHRVVRCRRRRSREGPFHHHFLPVGGPSSPTNTSNCSAATPTSEHSSVYSLAAEMDMTPTRPSVTPDERSECINPVALTLWRGGEEDREWLQEQDRSWSHSSPVASPSTRIPAPRQVSNSLRDVYGANYYCEISRPIPMLARRQEDAYFVNRMK